MYDLVLTALGLEKLTNLKSIDLSGVVVGSGEITPSLTTTDLLDKKATIPITKISKDVQDSATLVIEANMGVEVGGFEINEIGVIDGSGNLFAVGRFPRTYKPSIDESSAKAIKLLIKIKSSNADKIELKVDNTKVYATIESLIELKTGTNLKLDLKADKTQLPNLEPYATKDMLDKGLENAQSKTDEKLSLKADKTELPSLDGYALKSDIAPLNNEIKDLKDDYSGSFSPGMIVTSIIGLEPKYFKAFNNQFLIYEMYKDAIDFINQNNKINFELSVYDDVIVNLPNAMPFLTITKFFLYLGKPNPLSKQITELIQPLLTKPDLIIDQGADKLNLDECFTLSFTGKDGKHKTFGLNLDGVKIAISHGFDSNLYIADFKIKQNTEEKLIQRAVIKSIVDNTYTFIFYDEWGFIDESKKEISYTIAEPTDITATNEYDQYFLTNFTYVDGSEDNIFAKIRVKAKELKAYSGLKLIGEKRITKELAIKLREAIDNEISEIEI